MSRPQSRVNHVAPIRMIARIALHVLTVIPQRKIPPSLVLKAHLPAKLTLTQGEIIRVNEVMPGVVRRVNVDHLHPPHVRLLQDLQRLQVIPLNVEIARLSEIHALLNARPQDLIHRPACLLHCLTLARPRESVIFPAVIHNLSFPQ